VQHSLGPIHRLDTGGSGLLLVADCLEAYDFLERQLSAKTLLREYATSCHGLIPLGVSEINA